MAPLEPPDLVDCASCPAGVLSAELLGSDVLFTLDPDDRLGLLVPVFDEDVDGAAAAPAVDDGGGWPGAFFNCQLLSSIDMNFFKRSRYWLYSSTSL